jgi:hypothetical protein
LDQDISGNPSPLCTYTDPKIDIRPDGVSGAVDLLVRHFRPQDDVGDDLDGGVQAAAVDRRGVQEGVASRLAIADAAKFFQPGINVVIFEMFLPKKCLCF